MRQSLKKPDVILLAYAAGAFSPLGWPYITSLGFLGLLVSISLVLTVRSTNWLPVLVYSIAFSYSSLIFAAHHSKTLPRSVEGQNLELMGTISSLPDSNKTRTKFLFRIHKVVTAPKEWAQNQSILNKQIIQLSCYRCPLEILPDQRWTFTVRLKNPHGYASWGAYDFEKYLFRHKIVARGYIRTKQTSRLHGTERTSVNRYRWQIRQRLSAQLSDYPKALGVITALMIGDKSLLNKVQKQGFQNTGVSHLMAISGLHVGLVFISISLLFRYLLWPAAGIFNLWPRQQMVLIPALAGALMYSALAGFAVSTQRAFIMLSVYVLCRLFARDVPLLKVLLLAVVLLVMFDPFSILDVGFWLSCGAVLVIGTLVYYRGTLNLLRLQPLLWLGMIPMTSFFFGQVSLISPLVNLVVVPIFCVAVIPCVLISLVLFQTGLGSLSGMLLQVLAVGLEIFSEYLTRLSDWSYAVVFPPGFTLWQIVGLSLILVAYLGRWHLRHATIIVALFGLILWPVDRLAEGEFNVALLDVGQGLSMVIEVGDQVVVYDTGPAFQSGFNAAEAVLIPFLRHRGISKVDRLIISHADNDHIGGLAKLQEAFQIDQILTSRVDKIPSAMPCKAGTNWTTSGVYFSIISPDLTTPEGSNNKSCVLSIDNGSHRVLITGDIEKPVERHLLRSPTPLESDIILVPHQGSKTSSTDEFLAATRPKLGLIAAGYRNHYGHPHTDVVARYRRLGVELQSTVVSGTILLKLNTRDWSYSSYRKVNKRFWHRQIKPN